jgi:hypothetical protein
MSASRDKNQKITFVYSNLYQLYKKGTDAAKNAEVPSAAPVGISPGLRTEKPQTRVLRSDNAHGPGSVAPKVTEYQPVELLAKRQPQVVARPTVIPSDAVAPRIQAQARVVPNAALAGLKENLETLNSLHSRLKFMLQELEDLVKED